MGHTWLFRARRWLRDFSAFHCLAAIGALLSIALFPDTQHAALLLGVMGTTTQRRALKDILKEAKAIQDKFRGQPMPEDQAKIFESLCEEADHYQREDEREGKIRRMEARAKESTKVDDPALPNGQKSADDDDDDGDDAIQRATQTKNARMAGIAGFVTLGDYVRLSPQFQKFLNNGLPKSEIKFAVPSLLRVKGWTRDGVVPMGREMRQQFEEMAAREFKSLPTMASRVIEPDRLSDIVFDDENDELVMRDIVNVVPTTSNLIEWVGKTSYTRAADIVSDGAAKPEAAVDFDLRQTSIRTIAVWIPVTEQQLQDAPQLISIIQTDLRYDLGKVEEEQMVWGAGASLDFDGLENNIAVGRTSGGDTLIDKIRRAITDVRVDGYRPNGVAMHPYDWEDIQLAKGSDNHYIWVVITDANNVSRVWGVRVVETVAMLNPAASSRIVIVGDWRRGATLYDRMQSSVAIGYKDDDFIRNLRTIRAELRSGFAVRRPDALRQIVTL